MPCLLMLLWLASVIGVWVCVARGFRDTAGEADADRRSSARAAILLAAVPPTAVFLVTAFVLLQAAPTVQFNAGSSLAIEYRGTPADAQPLKDFLEPQLRAAKEKNMEARFEIGFSEGLPLSGDAPEKLTEQLTRFATGSAYVEAMAEAKT